MTSLAGLGYGTVAAGAVGGAGLGMFSYNKGNYQMDQKMHYTRYTAAIGLACAQQGQYRADLADLIGITANRMHLYIDVAGMTATIITALFCPGRVGLHTPPPPGWNMGLMMCNLGCCYLWLGLTIWLGIHATLRSDVCTTHMLTRFLRMPIPTNYMLDRARKFLSSWEEQPLREVFRIPFTSHWSGKGKYNDDPNMPLDPDCKSRTRHGKDLPEWYKKEKECDHAYAAESMFPGSSDDSAVPQHFSVFRELQNEWWPYDAYCRICMFLAYMHLAHAWCYHQLGHHLAETRSVFAVGTVILPLTIMQYGILMMDITPGKSGEIPLEFIGPIAQWFGYIAMALEYKRWYSSGGLALSVVLVYICYIIHIIYTCQLLRICAPEMIEAPRPSEIPGAAWWPGSWKLPSAFQNAYYIVAPPDGLEAGQYDLVGEMRKQAQGSNSDGLKSDLQKKRRDVHRELGGMKEFPAWNTVKVGLIMSIVCWVWLVFGYTIEVINQGTMHPSLISAPGMPNNARDPRYRPAKVGAAEATEVGTGGVERGPAKGMEEEHVERRLHDLGLGYLQMDDQTRAEKKEVAEKLRDLMPYLAALSHGDAVSAAEASAAPMLPSGARVPARASVRWPALFEPRLMACGPTASAGKPLVAATLSRHGRGAIITSSESVSEAELGMPTDVLPFVLEGVTAHGPLVAAAWDELGFLVATATGAVLECPGQGPVEGRWHCKPRAGANLPLGNTHFTGSIAIGRHPHAAELRAAVVFPGESTVTMLSQQNEDASPWLPTGEVRTSSSSTVASFASSVDALLLSMADGAISQMHMADGSSKEAASSIATHQDHLWQASCSTADGNIARLALSPKSQAQPPIVFLG